MDWNSDTVRITFSHYEPTLALQSATEALLPLTEVRSMAAVTETLAVPG